jgi:hypothetical protein
MEHNERDHRQVVSSRMLVMVNSDKNTEKPLRVRCMTGTRKRFMIYYLPVSTTCQQLK